MINLSYLLFSCKENIEKGALRIPLVAQNSSLLLVPKVAASLKLHNSTTSRCFYWFLAKNLQPNKFAKLVQYAQCNLHLLTGDIKQPIKQKGQNDSQGA